MRTLSCTAEDRDEGRALRNVLPHRLKLGVHLYRRLKVMNCIFVNGKNARADQILHAGDLLEVRIPDSLEGDNAPAETNFGGLPESRILYMDEDLIVVSKGAPLPSLPCAHIRTGTLREQLAGMLKIDASRFLYHPVNRLDKGTSGLMIVAKNAHSQRLLTNQLHTDGFIREYLAVTEGIPSPASGIIDAPIRREGTGARRIVSEDGQSARTRYQLLGSFPSAGRSLIRLHLDTGRTHQIRVHLAHMGCPVCGDYLYGTPLPELPGRFALHSAFLSFLHPISGNRLCFYDPLPPALRELCVVECPGEETLRNVFYAGPLNPAG